MNEIRVLHIDTAKTWRGGQNQVFLLQKGLEQSNIFSLIICQPNSELQKRCRREKLHFIPITMKGELDVLAAYKIVRVAKKLKINILHSHTAHALSLGLIVKLLHPKILLIFTKRVAFPIKKNLFSVVKYRNRLINQILCISDYIKDSLHSDGVSLPRLRTIPSSIRLQTDKSVDLQLRKILQLPENSFIVITAAALETGKGYETIIKAAKILKNTHTDVFFVCLGKGKHKTELKRMIADLYLTTRVFFLGFKPNVRTYLRASDVFILVSKEEGFGGSILEAYAEGLPVIASKTGGLPELVKDGKTGIIVPVDDPHALAEKILYLKNNSNIRKKFSRASLILVKAYSSQRIIKKIAAVYQKLITNI